MIVGPIEAELKSCDTGEVFFGDVWVCETCRHVVRFVRAGDESPKFMGREDSCLMGCKGCECDRRN